MPNCRTKMCAGARGESRSGGESKRRRLDRLHVVLLWFARSVVRAEWAVADAVSVAQTTTDRSVAGHARGRLMKEERANRREPVSDLARAALQRASTRSTSCSSASRDLRGLL